MAPKTESSEDDVLAQRRALSSAMWDQRFSARVLDVGGELTETRCTEVHAELAFHGALHLTQTGLSDVPSLDARLASLGFGEFERFDAGGRTSADWQQKWVAPGLRRLDFYPPDLYLLPNNEVQYQRVAPARVLFFCQSPPTKGGRTFVHCARQVEHRLRRTRAGHGLLAKLEERGSCLETGFLDRAHPQKADNYFQSWQERFETEVPEQALARAQAQTELYDEVWWRDDAGSTQTLMTRITLPAFQHHENGERYMRFPRIALGAPTALNGHRRYPLGGGEDLSDEENHVLMKVYLETRQGVHWSAGDVVLFDNLRFAHSRESFEGSRGVWVAMAGQVHNCPDSAARPPERTPASVALPQGSGRIYQLPPVEHAYRSRQSARVFDAGGDLLGCAAEIRDQFRRHGALHVQNTGLRCDPSELPEEVLAELRFGPPHEFAWGGMKSGRTQREALGKHLRATDQYPSGMWLLPHNEVYYQHAVPARLLFYSGTAANTSTGGRTYVHSAQAFERELRSFGAPGRALIQRLRTEGMRIEMGFLDERHPRRGENYFRSWQERFGTHDRDEALSRCLGASDQFDEAWWKNDDGTFTLMTRKRLPCFYRPRTDDAYRDECMLFPRVALDGPALINGHRQYTLGAGDPLEPAHVDMLIDAFTSTREGVHYAAGDLLLVHNLRYGHSREAFEGERHLGVAMAGELRLEPLEWPPSSDGLSVGTSAPHREASC